MNQIFPLQLILAQGIGDVFIHRFFDYALCYGIDVAKKILCSASDLCSTFAIREKIANEIVCAEFAAEALAIRLNESGVKWVSLIDEKYPTRLRDILGKKAPPILFFRGNLNLCAEHAVGFCGSRSATEKGLSVTEKCCRQLVERDIVIVSGYAKGVDLTSHKTALQAKGKTIIVLAEGMYHFYEKKEVRGLFLPENHLVLSQFPPDLHWMGRNAMLRNSTMIALSDAMVLIESGLKGGTFAAGKECLHQNIPLFVIDYATPPGPSAEANPEFIKWGGMPIRGSHDGMPRLDQLFETVLSINTGGNYLVHKTDVRAKYRTLG